MSEDDIQHEYIPNLNTQEKRLIDGIGEGSAALAKDIKHSVVTRDMMLLTMMNQQPEIIGRLNELGLAGTQFFTSLYLRFENYKKYGYPPGPLVGLEKLFKGDDDGDKWKEKQEEPVQDFEMLEILANRFYTASIKAPGDDTTKVAQISRRKEELFLAFVEGVDHTHGFYKPSLLNSITKAKTDDKSSQHNVRSDLVDDHLFAYDRTGNTVLHPTLAALIPCKDKAPAPARSGGTSVRKLLLIGFAIYGAVTLCGKGCKLISGDKEKPSTPSGQIYTPKPPGL